ncbi:uncharacterized protein LOC102809709 [Saccoglossus kowalevskii]|uniref:Uncharacterized protein LOC102809709 n=1 Tax=Saccoglossus kowalevskii TaxID=10224 RepID=A0ABM0MZ43_SACKO|nr:PREDICTED: uncharacterized protein LOC102809709 [Saccoglossus kowalevskii]
MALFFVLFFVLFLSLAAVIDGNNETLLEKLSGFVADVNTAYAVTESFNDTIGSHFVTEMIIQNQVEEKQMKAGAKEIAETIVQLPNIQTLPEYIATSMDKLKHFAEQFLGTEQMKMPGYDHMNKIYSAIKELMHELVNTEQLLITDISSLTTQQCLMFMGEDYNRFNEAIDLLLANLEDVENPVGDESLREIGDEIDKMLSDSDQAKSLRIQHQLFYMEKMKSTMETVTCESENGRRGSPREAKRRFIRAVESRRCGSLHSYLERNGHVAGDMVLKMQRAINVMQRTTMVSYDDQLLVSIGKLTDKVRDWKSNLNLKMQFDSLIEDCQSAM